ncbi:DUF2147 domain-containing protein [Cupriavidus basilensis]|uniref:DUF2147 domain-containing protein n=1 Tax=Cupriavidus TaxID=106589 RepID=UPI0023E89428|nr:DUF2147 domain-containing protein [Cupriavidus basilensis]MDF3888650.1 DUF2147 domain-containing protein [Cupriavidus basilensis]
MHPLQSLLSLLSLFGAIRPGTGIRPAALALAAYLWTQAAAAQTVPAATGFEGLWHTEDRSVIELKPCPKAGHLCGYIAWSREGGTDEANPDRALRLRPICGLLILELHQFDGTMWKDGWVYDPEEGKTYKAALRKRDGKLFLRGFVGAEVFGETETWTVASGPEQACKP